MPGILPMKVIKMGSNAHMRIAQACDRCRSKKIRCDGIRPCCTQCSSVGFECKTSDKLSRRAFPRGYTESLEDRVRSLEGEVRELKDLLDEKDEKIDMLTRIRPQRHSPPAQTSHIPQDQTSDLPLHIPSTLDQTVYTVEQSPISSEDGNFDDYHGGASSALAFLNRFKHTVQEAGRLKPWTLLNTVGTRKTFHTEPGSMSAPQSAPPPPRLAADHYVNIFFQEWAPLFPIVHRPTFLAIYESFTDAPESINDNKSIAQLYLVFDLVATSQGVSRVDENNTLEHQWMYALQQLNTDYSLETLQCLLLAQLVSIAKGDTNQLLTYKALAMATCTRLGLQHSNKRFEANALVYEMRKRIFWSLYTIDAFSAVQLGQSTNVRDQEVFCEYPVDVDDEFITEEGFKALQPGESTRISSSLALFRAARILSKVLASIYPSAPTYQVSSNQISPLADELDEWHKSLSPHLRVPFAQDKPSVGTVNSRSPLICLVYHFIRALIYRPVLYASMSSPHVSSSILALSDASKRIVQILQLLTERGLTFSFCLNKSELLMVSGVGLLVQSLDLDVSSKVLLDNQRMLSTIVDQFGNIDATEQSAFTMMVSSIVPMNGQPQMIDSRSAADGAIQPSTSTTITATMKQQLKAMASKFSWSDNNKNSGINAQRRKTHIGIPMHHQPQFNSLDAMQMSTSEPSKTNQIPEQMAPFGPEKDPSQAGQARPRTHTNLDYLSFSSGTSTPGFETQFRLRQAQQTDWERLLATIDNGQTNIFDNIYGGPPVELLKDGASLKHLQRHSMGHAPAQEGSNWDTEMWAGPDQSMHQPELQRVITESEFSLSTDDGSGSTMPSIDGRTSTDGNDLYGAIVMPELVHGEDELWDAVETGFTIA